MIITDGDRSKKRLGFAKKLLYTIQDLDVPSKATVHEGFRFKVWQLKENDNTDGPYGGTITAPMGAVVLCSTENGVTISVAENWCGACTLYGDMYILFQGVLSGGALVSANHTSVIYGKTEEELIALGYQTLQFKPVQGAAYYKPPVGDPVLTAQYPCTPSVRPYRDGEAFNVTITDNVFVDFNNNSVPDFPYPLIDSSLTWYSSTGQSLGGKRSLAMAVGANNIWKTCLNMPDGSQVVFAESYYDWLDVGVSVVDNQFICATYFGETVDPVTGQSNPSMSHLLLRDVVPETSAMPAELRTLMLTLSISTIRPIGSYAFISSVGDNVFLTASIFLPLAIPIGGFDETINNWFGAHPAEEKWRMFLSLTIGDTVTVVDSSQFYALLQARAINSFLDGGVIDWDRPYNMMSYFFSWPNLPGLIDDFAWKPHDSVMFHGHDDAVYSWTRAAGSVKFDATGMTTATINVPAEVTDNEGVRPDISFCGVGLYLCICNKVGDSVLAVYYGSPFAPGTWTKLPDAPLYATLVHVRPVSVTVDSIFLIGVALFEPIGEPAMYRFASLMYDIETGGEWKLMMQLPDSIGTADNFTVGLFGNDPMVQELLNFPSPPPANPQNVIVPYDGYGSFRP